MAHKDEHPPVGHVAAAHIWGVCPSVVGSTSGSRIAASQSMREFGLDGTCSEEALGPMLLFSRPPSSPVLTMIRLAHLCLSCTLISISLITN